MTPADLAEGRRLLEAAKADDSNLRFSWQTYPVSPYTDSDIESWLYNHAADLLSEAEAAARLREENRILTASFADGFAAGVHSVVDRVIK